MRSGLILFATAIALVFSALLGVHYIGRSQLEDLPDFGEVPGFSFQTADGGSFSRSNLDGHVSVLSFFFTSCPETCPRVAASITQIARTFRTVPAVQFVSISVDPERDTPEALLAFGKKFHADPEHWQFLRGERAAVKAFSEGLKVGMPDAPVEHSTRLILVDQRGRMRGYFDAFSQDQTADLVVHIKRLVADDRS